MKKAVDELDATCAEAEAQAGEDDAAREERLRTLADAGYNPIIGVGFVYSDGGRQRRPRLPRGQLRGHRRLRLRPTTSPTTNVADLGFAENQGSFLVGVAAALKTKTDHVGFVGGINTP